MEQNTQWPALPFQKLRLLYHLKLTLWWFILLITKYKKLCAWQHGQKNDVLLPVPNHLHYAQVRSPRKLSYTHTPSSVQNILQ